MNFGADILKSEEKAILSLRSLYRAWGYEPYKMSKFEEYDLYVKNKSFLVSDNIITFTDTDGKLMALKPDVTLSIIKNTRDGEERKLYYNENVYRVSEGSYSYKEIMQTGLERIGDIDTYSIAEVLFLASKSLEEISKDFILDVSHLGLVSALIDKIHVSPNSKNALIKCLGEKNAHGIEQIVREEGIDDENASRLKRLVSCYGKPQTVIKELREFLTEEEFSLIIDEIEKILSCVACENIRLDFSVIGDVTYYNGIVFKGFINTLPTPVLSGGQYDALVKRLGKNSKAIGFAVYLDALENLSQMKEYDVDTVILYSDKNDPAEVFSKVSEYSNGENSTRAVKVLPEKLKYKNLVDLTKEG